MAQSSVLIPLIRHEASLKRGKCNKRQPFTRGWKIFYVVAGVLVLFAALTIGAANQQFDLSSIWYFSFGMLFMTFGMAYGHIQHEFKNGTSGWWLTLPYPRQVLVVSKVVGSLLHAIRIVGIVFGVAAIAGLFVTLIQSHGLTAEFGKFLITGLKWLLTTIAFMPFAAAFGTMLSIFTKTKARPATPILWVLLWVTFPFLGSTGLMQQFFGFTENGWFPFTIMIIAPVILSWVLAVVLTLITAYLLERKLSI